MAKPLPLMKGDVPPAEVLGLRPHPKSDADVSKGITELAWIRSFRKTQEGLLTQRVDLLKREYAEKYFVEIVEQDGQPAKRIAFADRERQLEETLLEYAREHKDDGFFPDGKQSRELTHGTIAWRDGSLSVKPLEGETEKTALQKIAEKLRLAARILKLLAEIPLGRNFPARLAVRVKYELNKADVLAAWRNQLVTNEQLQKYGLEVGRGPTEFWIDTADYVLQSEAEAKR